MRITMGEYQEAMNAAQKLENRLSAYDFKPMQHVHIRTDEHYVANIPSAFILQFKNYYIVFAEHHAPSVFHKDDVIDIFEYDVKVRSKIPQLVDFKPKKTI